jgi:Na+/H+ antiporter NhaD/arsenite permease-like protein
MSLDFLSPQFAAIMIFIVTYFFLATGWRSRAIAAMVGAAAMWALGVLHFEEMVGYVDFNALGLLFGMMVLVGVLREANFFMVVGVKLANLVSCRVNLLFLLLLFVTATLSAVLDNVTTVLFMVAITVDLSELLKMDPKPFILGEIFASNMGGTATLIGDPPNIMIASATGFTFSDFLDKAAPVSMMSTIIIVAFLYLLYRKQLQVKTAMKEIPMRIKDLVADWRLFRIGAVMLVITVALFFTHEIFHLAPSTVAVISATILLFLGGPRMPTILERVEWRTLIFFGCLFIVVGGLEKTGTIAWIAAELSKYIGGSSWVAISAVLWLSSIMSGFVDNVPFVAAFIPVIRDWGSISGLDVFPLWWAMAIGAGFGGNGTMIGASSNIVAIGVAEKRGVKFTFYEFMKTGFQVTVLSTAAANLMLISAFVL